MNAKETDLRACNINTVGCGMVRKNDLMMPRPCNTAGQERTKPRGKANRLNVANLFPYKEQTNYDNYDGNKERWTKSQRMADTSEQKRTHGREERTEV